MSTSSVHKALEKVMAREAKTDEQNLQRALKELAKVEKAYQGSIKETGKARRELQDVIKHQGRTIKALESAQKRHEKAQELLRKRDDAYDEKRHHESLRFQDIECAQTRLAETYQAKFAHDQQRERHKAKAYIEARHQQIMEEASRDHNSPITSFAPPSTPSD